MKNTKSANKQPLEQNLSIICKYNKDNNDDHEMSLMIIHDY